MKSYDEQKAELEARVAKLERENELLHASSNYRYLLAHNELRDIENFTRHSVLVRLEYTGAEESIPPFLLRQGLPDYLVGALQRAIREECEDFMEAAKSEGWA